MRRKMVAVAVAAVLAGALALTTGCTRVRLGSEPGTRISNESQNVALNGAAQLKLEISQGVGDLTVRGSSDATDMVKTEFTYSPADWKPIVSSATDSSTASVQISQPNSGPTPPFTDIRNSWVITLPTSTPTDLTLRSGVGTSKVDLSRVDVTTLDAVTGVGETTIDLSGPRLHDVAARIESGVGKLTIRVPATVGVRVNGRQEGVGNFSADGFTAEGNTWVNSAFSGTGPKIEIDLVRGVGDITLVLVP